MTAASMQFVSTNNGTYVFDPDLLPTISRSYQWMRRDPQAASHRRINVTLHGYFYGNNNHDIASQYQALANILADNTVLFVYSDGTTNIVSNRVYIEAYTEPEDWKQYDGQFTLTFYYYDAYANSTADSGVVVSYVSPGGTINFDPSPSWSRQLKPTRQNYRGQRVTFSGAVVGNEITVTLDGFLTAANPSALEAKVQAILAAIKQDGTLNYGGFSGPVRVVGYDIPAATPENFVDYTITFKYDDAAIIAFETDVKFSRLHHNPRITERPFCNSRRIQIGNLSGQTVTYSFFIRATDIATCRSLLATEAALVVIPGGLELPGGDEDWNYGDSSVRLKLTKYYDTPVLANLSGTISV